MTFLETLGFLVVILASLSGVAGFAYFAFCGVRQYVDDARTGAAYRVEDERWRTITRGMER